MKKYSYWLHSGVYSLLQRLAVMFFGLASFFVLARTLTTDQMGIWAHFLAITANIELIRYAFVKNAFIKYLSVHHEEANDEITTAALVLNIAVTGLIMVALFLFMPYLSAFLKAPGLTATTNVFLLGMLLLIPFSHFEWIQNSRGDFKGIFLAYMVRQGSWFLLMMIHLLVNKEISLSFLALYYSLGILVGTFIAYLFARKYLNKRHVFHTEWFMKLWRFGRVIFGSAISSMTFKNVDQFIVSNVVSLTAVAFYNTSLRIINLLDMPSQIIGDIMFPKSSIVSSSNNKMRLKEMYEKSVGAVLSIVIPAGIVILLFPKLLLLILAGQKYVGAAYIVRLMLINSIFTAFIKQFATIMDSSGKAKTNLFVITIMALVSIVLCYFFTKSYGLTGTVLGITATHVIGMLLSQYYLYRHYNIKFWNAFRYMINFYPEMFKIFKERINLKWRTNF